jgi:hypothetical protein
MATGICAAGRADRRRVCSTFVFPMRPGPRLKHGRERTKRRRQPAAEECPRAQFCGLPPSGSRTLHDCPVAWGASTRSSPTRRGPALAKPAAHVLSPRTSAAGGRKTHEGRTPQIERAGSAARSRTRVDGRAARQRRRVLSPARGRSRRPFGFRPCRRPRRSHPATGDVVMRMLYCSYDPPHVRRVCAGEGSEALSNDPGAVLSDLDAPRAGSRRRWRRRSRRPQACAGRATCHAEGLRDVCVER